jgi:hypothetical protein
LIRVIDHVVGHPQRSLLVLSVAINDHALEFLGKIETRSLDSSWAQLITVDEKITNQIEDRVEFVKIIAAQVPDQKLKNLWNILIGIFLGEFMYLQKAIV